MKRLLFIVTLLLSASVNAASTCPPLLDFSLADIDGKTRNLCTHAGKVVLGFPAPRAIESLLKAKPGQSQRAEAGK